jgi:capsular polysaccharide biosynthesis protein
VLHRTLPSGVPAGHDAFAADLREVVPPVEVAELPSGRVLGPHHALIDGEDRLVQQLSFYFGTNRARQHPLFLRTNPQPPLHVPGRLGVLATRGDLNYYHFLMDVLPRLGVLEQTPQIEPPDRWYVPAGQGFQRELLDRLGVTEDRRIDATEHRHVQADCLVVPAPPAMTVINPPWAVGWLRGKLLDGSLSRKPASGIYITRGGTANNRQVTNESEVTQMLVERGFRAIDPGKMTAAEQIAAFAEATCIVGSHGAAFGSLIFASAGSTVIELFPAGAALPDFWKLASGVEGLRYRYLCGCGPVRGRSRARLLVRDITVDLAQLGAMVDQAFQ